MRYLADFLQDVRYARRVLARSKGFAAVAILILALGIGANTAVFSIVHGALLRPLPYRDADRLYDVLDESARESRLSKLFDSYADYREYEQHATSFEGIAAATWAVRGPILSGHGPATRVMAVPASGSFFTLLGAQATRGRVFTAADKGHGCAVVLSHAFWTSNFGASNEAVGSTIQLDRQSCTILGVMPASFAFYPSAAQMWRLIDQDLPAAQPVFIVGRLKRGVTPAQAKQELTALHAAIEHTGTERELGPVLMPLQDEFTWLAGRNLRSTLWVLLGAVTMVMLIACLNIAGLLLGRSAARGRELAVRMAVGCSKARLMRQLLTEGLVLSIAGAGLGVLLAEVAIRWFQSVNPVELPPGIEITIGPAILLFTGAVTVLCAIVFGIAPAWKASRMDLRGRGSIAGGRQRAAKVMVAAEVALSMMLLAVGGLLMESVLSMQSAPLGDRPEHVYSASIALPSPRYSDTAVRLRFFEDLEARVQGAALTSSMPPYGIGNYVLQKAGRQIGTSHDVGVQWISPRYFQTLGVALVRGRGFDGRDRETTEKVCIIDDALAREYFPQADPIGQQIRVGDDTKQSWLTIVGIAAAELRSTVFQEMSWTESPTVFRPMTQDTPDNMTLAIKGAPNAAALQRAAAEMDPEVAMGELFPLEESLSRVLAYPRFRALLLGGFSIFALLLAAIGLHGVLAQLVTQRTQEIGVRMALGAQPRDVARLVALQGGAPVVIGLAIGLITTIALVKLLAAMLYGVKPRDPLTLAGAAVVLVLAASLAIALPAGRAARIDPLAALRGD